MGLLCHRSGRGVRSMLYGALAVVAALCAWQAWTAQQVQVGQTTASEAIRLVSTQRSHILAIALQAQSLATRPVAGSAAGADRLREALDESLGEALELDRLLSLPLADPGADDARRAQLRDMVLAWQAHRERLWYRAENLLRNLDAGIAPPANSLRLLALGFGHLGVAIAEGGALFADLLQALGVVVRDQRRDLSDCRCGHG
jgi:hypothetical protein